MPTGVHVSPPELAATSSSGPRCASTIRCFPDLQAEPCKRPLHRVSHLRLAAGAPISGSGPCCASTNRCLPHLRASREVECWEPMIAAILHGIFAGFGGTETTREVGMVPCSDNGRAGGAAARMCNAATHHGDMKPVARCVCCGDVGAPDAVDGVAAVGDKGGAVTARYHE